MRSGADQNSGVDSCTAGDVARVSQTIVVIGSGPTSPGLRSAFVDGHPVVRMWNHEWQPVERYGTRYDYGLITTNDDARLATRRPASGWFFYNVPSETVAQKINGDA